MIYLLWGIVATIPVNLLFPIFSPAFPTLPYSLTVSPLVEEFFKALPIIIPVIMGVKNSDEDLLTYAMAAGIGFSIIETWTVIDPSALQLTLVPVLSILARSFSTSLMHGCTCGIIGYGIVLIKNFDRGALPILLFGFYTLAVTIHAIFNLLSEHYQLIGTIIDLIFPVVLFFFLLTCYHVNLPILFKKTDSL